MATRLRGTKYDDANAEKWRKSERRGWVMIVFTLRLPGEDNWTMMVVRKVDLESDSVDFGRE